MSPRDSKRPNAGRPRLDEGSRVVSLRWPEEDYAEVERAAERDGVSVSEYVRRAASEHARRDGNCPRIRVETPRGTYYGPHEINPDTNACRWCGTSMDTAKEMP